MRSIRNISILIICLLTYTICFAQNSKKKSKASIKVEGVCGMCKERIEEACFSIKGVKSASWNKSTKILELVFTNATNLQAIETAIANAGHDNEGAKANDSTYKKLNSCCLYRDNAKCRE